MSNDLRIIVAQLNFWVGDIKGNTEKIIHSAQIARDELKGDIVVFPELALSGYPPEDLLLRQDFHYQIAQALQAIQAQTHGIVIILGHPHHNRHHTYNAASVIRDGKILLTYHKQLLPNYGVFDEKRYFSPGSTTGIYTHNNIPIAVLICEDLWFPEPIAHAAKAGAKLAICINASPVDIDKPYQREKIMRHRLSETPIPILYVHGIGGQDDLVFDGGSLAMDIQGQVCAHASFYQEKLFPIDVITNPPLTFKPTALSHPLSVEAHVYKALILSVHDYVKKNGFPGVLIGLSGGIDSALTAAIAVDALGKEHVHGVLMPSRYTSELSMSLAYAQAEQLGIKTSTLSIEPSFNAFLTTLAPEFSGLPPDHSEENIQARCRGVILMALSNKTGKIVLTTGNKSEMAVGYATLYGDMAGGFCVLKDVSKTLVYRLAHYRNAVTTVIPQGIIERPPTAELAPNQKDEDSLPPYAILDPILELYVEKDFSPAQIVAAGFAEDVVRKVIKMVERNEYKRRQAPPGPRITVRAFGRERRYPITSKYQSELT